MTARIYQPAKTAMQSGRAKTKIWVLDYEPEKPRQVEDLMGWTSSADMKSQIRLKFDSLEAAQHYAEEQGLDYEVIQPRPRIVRPKSYAGNFL